MNRVKTLRKIKVLVNFSSLLVLFLSFTSSIYAQCLKPGLVSWKTIITTSNGLIADGDFNGDGKTDLVWYEPPGKAVVALGVGGGDFGTPVAYTTGDGAQNLQLGDVNGDGKADLLLRTFAPAGLDIWMNSGSGTFSFANSLSNTGSFWGMADFNGDGKGDLLSVSTDGNLLVRLGNGAGAFTGAVTYNTPASPFHVEGLFFRDFNSDGKADVIVNSTSRQTSTPQVKMVLFEGDAGGGLNLISTTDMGALELNAAADPNGDGKPDLIGFNRSAMTVSALLNNGSAVFTAHVSPLSKPGGVEGVMDFNGDGHQDLGIRLSTPANGSSVLLGDGLGGFTAVDLPKLRLTGLGIYTDLDNDGKAEFLDQRNNPWTHETTFYEKKTTCTAKNDPTHIDFNGDGTSDAAVFRPSTGTWFISAPYYLFEPPVSKQFGQNGDIPTPGDFDGDGTTDLAVFRPLSGVWYVNKSGDQSVVGIQFGANGDKPVQGDYDGDGLTDIAVYRPSEGAWYYLYSSDGSYHGVQFGISTDAPVPVDFDGDGKIDIAVFRSSAGVWYILNSATATVTAYLWGTSGDRAVAADYDGDGKADVAVYRPSSGMWYVLRSVNGNMLTTQFGVATDIPVAGFYGGFNIGQNPPNAFPAVFRLGTTGYFLPSFAENSWGTLGKAGDISASSTYIVE
jgi:hypothetical protein